MFDTRRFFKIDFHHRLSGSHILVNLYSHLQSSHTAFAYHASNQQSSQMPPKGAEDWAGCKFNKLHNNNYAPIVRTYHLQPVFIVGTFLGRMRSLLTIQHERLGDPVWKTSNNA